MKGSRIHRARQDVRHPQQVGAQIQSLGLRKNKSRVLAWLAPKSLIQNYPDQMEQNYNLPFENGLQYGTPYVYVERMLFLPRVMWAGQVLGFRGSGFV